MSHDPAVIVATARTSMARLDGELASLDAKALGAAGVARRATSAS